MRDALRNSRSLVAQQWNGKSLHVAASPRIRDGYWCYLLLFHNMSYYWKGVVLQACADSIPDVLGVCCVWHPGLCNIQAKMVRCVTETCSPRLCAPCKKIVGYTLVPSSRWIPSEEAKLRTWLHDHSVSRSYAVNLGTMSPHSATCGRVDAARNLQCRLTSSSDCDLIHLLWAQFVWTFCWNWRNWISISMTSETCKQSSIRAHTV